MISIVAIIHHFSHSSRLVMISCTTTTPRQRQHDMLPTTRLALPSVGWRSSWEWGSSNVLRSIPMEIAWTEHVIISIQDCEKWASEGTLFLFVVHTSMGLHWVSPSNSVAFSLVASIPIFSIQLPDSFLYFCCTIYIQYSGHCIDRPLQGTQCQIYAEFLWERACKYLWL
jgi:hypothetical protein